MKNIQVPSKRKETCHVYFESFWMYLEKVKGNKQPSFDRQKMIGVSKYKAWKNFTPTTKLLICIFLFFFIDTENRFILLFVFTFDYFSKHINVIRWISTIMIIIIIISGCYYWKDGRYFLFVQDCSLTV